MRLPKARLRAPLVSKARKAPRLLLQPGPSLLRTKLQIRLRIKTLSMRAANLPQTLRAPRVPKGKPVSASAVAGAK